MHSQFLRGKLPNVIKTNFTRRSINSLATKSAVNTGFQKSALSLFSQKITLPSYTPKRTLVSYVELKGLHPNLKAKAPYSPLHGAEFIVTGALERLYDFALAELGNKAKEPSATSQLVTALFYRQGEQFRPTQNKSYPAYSLTPKRIAKLLHYLHQGTLDTAEARYALCAEWRKENISMTKLNKFLDCVSASQKESIAKQYPLLTTETLLLAFLCYKSETRRELIQDYLTELNTLSPVLNQNDTPNLEDTFEETDLDQGIVLLKNLSKINDPNQQVILDKNYETIMLTLMLMNQKLPVALMSRYHYRGQKSVASCVETTFHNLCNILLYNTELHKFDFSMMPEKLKLNPQLQDIYKMQNFTINKINSPLIGQAFMDLLSGQDKFQYISGDYELKATTENFLPVMNYLFGSTANSLKEFAEQFSDEKRQIQITLEPADDNRLTCIVITLQQPEKKPSIVELHFTPDHAEISAECLNSSKTLRTSGIEFQQLLDLAYDNRYKYPSLLPVVCDTLKMAYKVFHFKAEECLYYPFIHFFPQNAEDACYFLDAAIPLLTRIPQLESYCEGLISKFDSLIYSAVYMGKKASVEFILARGGVKAIQGEMHGRSLLCIAAFSGDLDIVKILIEKGANPNEVMPDGETPLTLAIDRSNHDVVAYLKAEQAKNHRHTNAEVTRAWVPSMRL